MLITAFAIHVSRRSSYPNPTLDWQDLSKVEKIAQICADSPFRQVISGSGTRFSQATEILTEARAIDGGPKIVSLILGCTDYQIDSGMILSDGHFVLKKNYHRPIDIPGFNPWLYLAGLGDNVLIITEIPFLQRLGQAEPQAYVLYEIDTDRQVLCFKTN